MVDGAYRAEDYDGYRQIFVQARQTPLYTTGTNKYYPYFWRAKLVRHLMSEREVTNTCACVNTA